MGYTIPSISLQSLFWMAQLPIQMLSFACEVILERGWSLPNNLATGSHSQKSGWRRPPPKWNHSSQWMFESEAQESELSNHCSVKTSHHFKEILSHPKKSSKAWRLSFEIQQLRCLAKITSRLRQSNSQIKFFILDTLNYIFIAYRKTFVCIQKYYTT